MWLSDQSAEVSLEEEVLLLLAYCAPGGTGWETRQNDYNILRLSVIKNKNVCKQHITYATADPASVHFKKKIAIAAVWHCVVFEATTRGYQNVYT